LLLTKDFYDYEDKYKNNQATVRIPAKISNEQKKKIQEFAVKVYKLCDCSGFARIDFFIADKKIYLNEVNTLPGFTDISIVKTAEEIKCAIVTSDLALHCRLLEKGYNSAHFRAIGKNVDPFHALCLCY
jgi:D-alanine--D-alanine ligase